MPTRLEFSTADELALVAIDKMSALQTTTNRFSKLRNVSE